MTSPTKPLNQGCGALHFRKHGSGSIAVFV